MAAAFPFTVSTTGRLVFLSCFIKSPERRRKVVSDWVALPMTTTQTKDLAERYCKVVIPVSTCPSRSVARNDNSEGGGPLRLSACHYNPQFSIVEGQGRLGAAEFRHFLPQARGSLMELETQVLIAERLCYVRPEPAREILLQAAELGRVLNGLLNSLSTGN